MKTKKVINLILAAVFFWQAVARQTGIIYTHLKHISEENSPAASTPPDYSFVLKNSSSAMVGNFSLNDQATADNLPNSGNFLSAYDLGLSHGTGGDGQLWAVAGTSLGMSEAGNAVTGTSYSFDNAIGSIYYRNAASAVWNHARNSTTAITGVKYQQQ